MEKEIKYQWALRVKEIYYDDFDEDTQYEEIFESEEEALNELKEKYEYDLEENEICDSEINLKDKSATYSIEYNDEIVGRVHMWVVKQKSDCLDMTIEEFWHKISFIYGEEEITNCNAEAYETQAFLSKLSEERWIYVSPYYTFKLKGFWYSPHPDDCIYHIEGDGFSNDYYKSYSRETKMRDILQEIKNDDEKYYKTILSNIKEITDSGCKYIIDINRQNYIYDYITLHQNEYNVKGYWELKNSIYAITSLTDKNNDGSDNNDYEEDEDDVEDDVFDVICPMCGKEFECGWSDLEIDNDRYYYTCDCCGTRIRQF